MPKKDMVGMQLTLIANARLKQMQTERKQMEMDKNKNKTKTKTETEAKAKKQARLSSDRSMGVPQQVNMSFNAV